MRALLAPGSQRCHVPGAPCLYAICAHQHNGASPPSAGITNLQGTGCEKGMPDDKAITVSKNDDMWATCFMRTSSEGAVQGKLPCPLSPARRSRGVLGERLDAVTRIARTPALLPKGAIYLGTGKHCSVGKVLTMAMLPPSRHSWQGVQMDTNDSAWGQSLGTVTRR